MELKESNIKKLKGRLYNLHQISIDVKSMVHGIDHGMPINDKYNFKLFEPTKFIYTFFFFNTLYDIDWERSMKLGNIILSHEDYEDDKIKNMIDFFCEDNDFMKKSMNNFVLYLQDKYHDPTIFKNVLNKIVPDRSIYAGGFKKKDVIDYFTFLYQGKITIKRLKDIAYYIYKIRCNIFHGSKDMNCMKDPDQIERLAIYTQFLFCLIDMPFNYIMSHNIQET